MHLIDTRHNDDEERESVPTHVVIDLPFLTSLITAVTDNHRTTPDRYTIYFHDSSTLSLEQNPFHPEAVSNFTEDNPFQPVNLRPEEQVIQFQDLPQPIQIHVLEQVRAAYRDWIRDNNALTINQMRRAIRRETT